MCFWNNFYIVVFLIFCFDVLKLAKIRLFIRSRKQGSYIASIPLKKLVKLSKFPRKRWDFKDGWLILKAR